MKSQLDIGNKDHLFLSTFIKMQQKSHLSDILLWLNKPNGTISNDMDI